MKEEMSLNKIGMHWILDESWRNLGLNFNLGCDFEYSDKNLDGNWK